MRITISGHPGSGKSTIAKELAKRLSMKYVGIGTIMRKLADEKGISLLELGEMAKKDKSIDEYIDNEQKKLKDEDNIIIDSRIGFHFIPSLKIFLTIDDDEAAKRVMNREDYKGKSIDEVKRELIERRNQEYSRYKKYYNIDLFDKKQFDIVIDTTKKSVEGILDEIIAFIDHQYQHHT